MKLQELICDRQGRFSPILVHFHLWTAAVLTMWIIACVKAGTIVGIDASLIAVLGLNGGTILGFRVAERNEKV
jgi:hypothetical protein